MTVTVVDDFKAKLLAAGVGESQTRQALAVLSGMFTYAERRGRVSKNPVRPSPFSPLWRAPRIGPTVVLG